MLQNNLVLFFDGACTKNPGGIASYGFKFSCKDTEVLIYSDFGEVCRGETASCNIAEWASITKAICYLKDQGWSGQLEIFGDSQLVIRQLNGEYKVRKDTLIPYYQECIKFLQGIEKWKVTWIPREQNEECDKLSKKQSF